MKLTGTILICAFFTLAINFRHDVDMKKYEEKGKEVQFESVGKLLESKDSSFKGSCVLISPTQVLIAAHSIDKSEKKPDTVEQSGGSKVTMEIVRQYFQKPEELQVKVADQILNVSKVSVHPNYLDSLKDADLAILTLTKPVEDIVPAILNTKIKSLNGKIGWGAGWGAIESGDRSYSEGPNKKRLAGSNVIDTAYDYEFWIDFDHPLTDTCCNKFGSPDALDMEFSPNGGDSGSGMFVEIAGKWYLVGILSTSIYEVNTKNIKRGIYHSYGSQHKYIDVYKTLDWINENLER